MTWCVRQSRLRLGDAVTVDGELRDRPHLLLQGTRPSAFAAPTPCARLQQFHHSIDTVQLQQDRCLKIICTLSLRQALRVLGQRREPGRRAWAMLT